MRKCLALVVVVVGFVVCGPLPVVFAATRTGSAFTKLSRGAVNILTGWVEIPMRIQETSESSGTAAGWTWGLLRGVGHGFVRTAAGFYELVTFPFPAPPNYEPVIQPEFVYTTESSDREHD